MYLYIRQNIASKFPKAERYELTSQLLRASLSVPLNISEGCGRYSDKDLAHFLDISLGSTNESDYCCYVALELSYITPEEYNVVNELLNGVRAMLINFIKFLRKEDGKRGMVDGGR
jgi:four helix bundle protein